VLLGPACPRVTESGGRRKGKNATGRGTPYIGGTLGESAAAAGRTRSFLAAKYRDLGPGYYEQRAGTRRQVRSHVRSLERYGYKVTIEPIDPGTGPETSESVTKAS
jgi:transposase